MFPETQLEFIGFLPAAKLLAGIPSPITLFSSVCAIVMRFVWWNKGLSNLRNIGLAISSTSVNSFVFAKSVNRPVRFVCSLLYPHPPRSVPAIGSTPFWGPASASSRPRRLSAQSISAIPFRSVVRTAEHLAVLDVRRAALRPRRDVVGVHFVELPDVLRVCVVSDSTERTV